jgi:MFS family permease
MGFLVTRWSWEQQPELAGARLARISAFGFGYTALATSFTAFILPTFVSDLVAEESKNTDLGVLSFVALMIALVVQPVVGGLSDRLQTSWGRRAPFILLGAVLSVPMIVAVGVASSYVLLFVFVCVLQLFANSALGPYQGLIRDLVPPGRRGAASGMKMLVEVAGALTVTALVSKFIGRYEGTGNFLWVWASTGVLAGMVLLGAVTTTAAIKVIRGPSLPATPKDEVVDVRPHPDFKWFLLSRFVLTIGVASLQTFALFFLEDSVGIENPVDELWKLILVVGAAAVIVSYPAGLLADRWGRRSVMFFAGIVAVPSTLVLFFASSLGAVMVVAGFAGAALGLFLGANWAMASDLVSSQRTAQQLGYINIATVAGAGLARLNGLWVDALNSGGRDSGYSVLVVLCGILFFAGGLLLLRVRQIEVLAPPAATTFGERPLP